jgi:hypothetical protein
MSLHRFEPAQNHVCAVFERDEINGVPLMRRRRKVCDFTYLHQACITVSFGDLQVIISSRLHSLGIS